jgi:hypothetical protein
MAMSKALKEELRKLGAKGARKAMQVTTPEQRKENARKGARARHLKAGHKVKPLEEEAPAA